MTSINVKKHLLNFVFAPVIIGNLISCKERPKEVEVVAKNYPYEILEWRANRIESLKSKDGWLNLAGLFWLKEGENTVGSDSINNIVFPKGKSDGLVGFYFLKDGNIEFTANPKSTITQKDSVISSVAVFPSETPIVLKHKNLAWFVIQRGDKFAVRLRDFDSELSKKFNGINNYDLDEQLLVKAKFVPSFNKTISIVDITERISEQESPGTLFFEIAGEKYSLDALSSSEGLFIIFGDKTNGGETYQSGRFIDAPLPDNEGFTWVDFNKAYNPPCAFTPYSTCPLPPKQNILPISIKAGEKRFEKELTSKTI